MSDMHITVEAGKTKRLLAEGKLCDKNIVVEASGDGYSQGFEDGKQAEYDAFWDIYQSNGERKHYANAFYNKYWNDETYNPKYDMNDVSNSTNMFSYAVITDTKVDIGISNATDTTAMFGYSSRLITIRKLIVSETTPFKSTTFVGCSALVNITIEGTIGVSISFPNSSKLSDASVQSIIDALKDLTGQTGQKLTLHADVGARLTQAQKDTITAKNWTLAY